MLTVLEVLAGVALGLVWLEVARQLGFLPGAFWINLPTAHQRVLANFLKRRGWVVFYLEEEHRHCSRLYPSCWLALYHESEIREQRAREQRCDRVRSGRELLH